MDFVFADDARQDRPSRQGMTGPLIGVGGLHVTADRVGPLERAIGDACSAAGLAPDQQFKWSPGKPEAFFRERFTGSPRTEFFCRLLELAAAHGATATVVVSDASKGKARVSSASHEIDVTTLFLERCARAYGHGFGLPIIAKPSGGVTDEKKFLAACLDVIRQGTEFVAFRSLVLGVVTVPSSQIRLLQLADVVASCTVARVGGESPFSQPVFRAILPLFRRVGDRIEGIGLKVHPDYCYCNLYHWLLGAKTWFKGTGGYPLPQKGFPYSFEDGELGRNEQQWPKHSRPDRAS